MYIIKHKNIKYKLTDKESLFSIDGFLFGRGTHKIAGSKITNLKIYNKKLVHPIVKKQVDKKYKKLILILTELLVSDDESGSSMMEALNQIEKFRQIIKNKYRNYLTKKDLQTMSKQLALLQKQAKEKMLEINLSMEQTKNRTSCR